MTAFLRCDMHKNAKRRIFMLMCYKNEALKVQFDVFFAIFATTR